MRPPVDAALRDELCRVGASLFARGYVHGTTGNLSVRLPNGGGYLITPTDASLGALDAHALSHVDLQGQLVSGARASKTLALHRVIYDHCPNARAIIHTHSTHLVALTLAGVWSSDAIVPPITPYFAMKVGRVPLIPYHRPGDPAAAQAVAARIRDASAHQQTLRAVMMDRLGPNVWHASLSEAAAVLEELEETAKLWLMTSPKPAPLSEPALQALREHFNAAW